MGLQQDEDGIFLVRTASHSYTARHVCLALGRRGIPAKLNVPGEDLPKVAYSLLDAQSYQGLPQLPPPDLVLQKCHQKLK